MLEKFHKSYKEQGRRNAHIETLDNPHVVREKIYAADFMDGVLYFKPEQEKLDTLNKTFNETADLYRSYGHSLSNGVPSEINNRPYSLNSPFYSKDMFAEEYMHEYKTGLQTTKLMEAYRHVIGECLADGNNGTFYTILSKVQRGRMHRHRGLDSGKKDELSAALALNSSALTTIVPGPNNTVISAPADVIVFTGPHAWHASPKTARPVMVCGTAATPQALMPSAMGS